MLEVVGLVPKRDAAVTLGMLVAAFKALSRATEQERAGCHERVTRL